MLIKPKKSLGQNFLIDKNVLRKISDSVPINKTSEILEIGPGTGNLTEFILKKKPKKIFVIEKDNYLAKILGQRYKDSNKYQCSIKDIMMKTLEEDFDIIINCSCEHMYPMTKFYEWNPELQDPLYVLQSTDDDQYDDHINCVGSPEELADQAKIAEVLYSGTKVLPNGMNRFMVIGYPT